MVAPADYALLDRARRRQRAAVEGEETVQHLLDRANENLVPAIGRNRVAVKVRRNDVIHDKALDDADQLAHLDGQVVQCQGIRTWRGHGRLFSERREPHHG